MIIDELLYLRLRNQQISGTSFLKPEDLVAYFCGMQAQDYLSSKWGIGQRVHGLTETLVDQAIADRKVIRSWLMRGTLHITTSNDIRWLLDLLAPKLIKAGAGRNRQLELDEKTFNRSNEIICRALEGRNELSRSELSQLLEQSGIQTNGQRLPHLFQRASYEKLICFGEKKSKEFTFVLMDDFVPVTKLKSRDEALVELATRYFISRGPATLPDFAWWSGLSMGDARKGLEGAMPLLQNETINGQTYYFSLPSDTAMASVNGALLLPAFDEYVISYKDRSALLNAKQSSRVISTNGIFYPVIVINGKVVGTWKRSFKKSNVVEITLNPFRELSKSEERKVTEAAGNFGAFSDRKVVIE